MTIPLPEYSERFAPRWPGDIGGYEADQILCYGAAVRADERERCAAILLANAQACTGLTREILLANVAAIRKGE